MSEQAAYFEAQTRLTRWTDELEFLSYILCELIDAGPLNALGYRCHQAADLPALMNIIRPHTTEHSGSLAAVMSGDELSDFRRLISEAKQIRNKSAHHVTQNVDALDRLEDCKRRFGDMLELAIKRVASGRAIYQMPWSPSRHVYKACTEEVVLVPLNDDESLLSFREKTLCEHLPDRRRKRRSTEESRQNQESAYKAACQRRQQRRQRHMAVQADQLLAKLHRLEQNFSRSQELGYAQINKIGLRMKKEQEIFHDQRSKILMDAKPVSCEESSFLLVWLAVCSPLWVPLAFIRHFYNRYSGKLTGTELS